MFSDFHVHTEFSPDSSTPVKEQIEQAIKLGMKEICITDHHDYGVVCETDFTLDAKNYITFLKKIKDFYKDQIHVNIGIELGLQLQIKDYLDLFVTDHDFDFIIGSSHHIDGIDPYYPSFFEGRIERESYERYFEVTLERVQKLNCFDVFGHLDYIVRYGPNKNQFYTYELYREYIDPILKTLIEKGKGLECNTGGYQYKLGHPNPCEEILIRYRELGGELLTIGSDAHNPTRLGYHFNALRDILINCGFQYYTIYHLRQPIFLRL